MAERDKPRGERPDRRGWEHRGRDGRPKNGPPAHREWKDRPPRDAQRGDRPASDRPRTDRPASDRPRQDRPWQARPPQHRPPQDRPQQGDRPPAERASDDRPQRAERREDRPWTARPPRDGRPYPDRHGRPFQARPPFRGRPPAAPPPDRDALLGEGEELIAGRRPVEEAFAARREVVRLLVVPERRAALDALAIHATTLRIPVVEVEGGTLTALAGFDGHQGVALVARPRPGGDVDSILARARERNETPFVLVLDSLEDPQNFGTLLRSAEATGIHGVVYPTRRAAPLSPAAIKASAGATEHLVLAAVDDLASTLADLHASGLRLVGADERAALDYADADLRGPLAIVVGSEGRGMSGPVRRRLDMVVRIPMRGKIESLNAAVAGSILLFAAASQRPLPSASGSTSPAPVTQDDRGDDTQPESAADEPLEAPAAEQTVETGEALLPGDG